MYKVESSIIIPVLDNWGLTRNCLQAIATTTTDKFIEVIVVDNGSSDATPNECPVLGRQLFGEAFHYHRNLENLNFGPASNIGAKLASGEFLVFLNNDTVPLPDWYNPLIKDFSDYPDIAATGPLLLFPKETPFGYTVQHLGVYISPTYVIDHLYQYIPADCALAKKRRFFQVITAACMAIRRSVFLDAGMFDEHYINGFEDVELCAILSSKGYKTTVNPLSKVIHKESQTPRRHDLNETNFQYLLSHGLKYLVPDWHRFVKDDGMFLRLDAWQNLQTSISNEHCKGLDKILEKADSEVILDILLDNPFWEKGWRQLSRKIKSEMNYDLALRRLTVGNFWDKIYPSPDAALELYDSAIECGDMELAKYALDRLHYYCMPFNVYVNRCDKVYKWCSKFAGREIADQYSLWLDKKELFKKKSFFPFINKFWEIAKNFPLPPGESWAYVLWLENIETPLREKHAKENKQTTDGIAFSILMPVYNPKPEHLIPAIESVLAQQYEHWELCIADDASTRSDVKIILTKYSKKDSRIRVVWRPENGHIAAATNTALAMAQKPYIVLLDQDDVLTQDALRIVAENITDYPDGLLFYSDEDKIDDNDLVFDPYFKSDKWDWELLFAQNFVSHLGVYRTDRMRDIGGFRKDYPSSQDYDMLLRFCTGIDVAHIHHIPHVLYHWRAHQGSTAEDINVKEEARDSARRAMQKYLDINFPDAQSQEMSNSAFLRVKFPLPEKRPFVSLICDLEGQYHRLQAQINALLNATLYEEYEILILMDEDAPQSLLYSLKLFSDKQENIRVLLYQHGLSQSERFKFGADHSCGTILGFLHGGVTPVNKDWLDEIVSCLCREEVGTVAGKLLNEDMTLVHGGYLVDATGRLNAILCGAPSSTPIYFAWNTLARTVDSHDGLCLFTQKNIFFDAFGFDTKLGDFAVIDYCLRLGELGLRSVWWPFAEFKMHDDAQNNYDVSMKSTNDILFYERWAGKLIPFSRNLVASNICFSLSTGDIRNK
jgi:GT2 family glycosyltransferase